MTGDKSEFATLQSIEQKLKIDGIVAGLPVEGVGKVRWLIKDETGQAIELFVRNVLYVPGLPTTLICPQQIAQQTKKAEVGFQALTTHGTLTVGGLRIKIAYNATCNLPMIQINAGIDKLYSYFGEQTLSEESERRLNLSKNQQELLAIHYRLSHLGFE